MIDVADDNFGSAIDLMHQIQSLSDGDVIVIARVPAMTVIDYDYLSRLMQDFVSSARSPDDKK